MNLRIIIKRLLVIAPLVIAGCDRQARQPDPSTSWASTSNITSLSSGDVDSSDSPSSENGSQQSSNYDAVPEEVNITQGSAISLTQGGIQALSATVLPSTANQTISWSSGNAAIASVSPLGTVTAVAPGTTTITATSVLASVKDSIQVTVDPAIYQPAGVEIALVVFDFLEIDEQLTLSAVVQPAQANQSITWTSSNEAIATVSNNGVVTGVGAGEVTIRAAATGKPEIYDEQVLDVTLKHIRALEITGAPTSPLKVTDQITLGVNLTPSTNVNSALAWTSSDQAVASVVDGVVTALAPGKTNIKVTPKQNLTISSVVEVEVEYKDVIGVAIDQGDVSVEAGRSIQLSATIYPLGANPNVTWSATGDVTVDENGKVIVGLSGSGSVTATSQGNTSLSDTIDITITQPALRSSVSIIPTDIPGTGYLNGAIKNITCLDGAEQISFFGQYVMKEGSNIQFSNSTGKIGNTVALELVSLSLTYSGTATTMMLYAGSSDDFEEMDVIDYDSQSASYLFRAQDRYFVLKNGSSTTKLTKIDLVFSYLGALPPVDPTGVIINDGDADVSVEVGRGAFLHAVVTPHDRVTNPNVVWSIVDESVATISDQGEVIGLAIGETTVKAASQSHPDISSTIRVIVVAFSSTEQTIGVVKEDLVAGYAYNASKICTDGTGQSIVLYFNRVQKGSSPVSIQLESKNGYVSNVNPGNLSSSTSLILKSLSFDVISFTSTPVLTAGDTALDTLPDTVEKSPSSTDAKYTYYFNSSHRFFRLKAGDSVAYIDNVTITYYDV